MERDSGARTASFDKSVVFWWSQDVGLIRSAPEMRMATSQTMSMQGRDYGGWASDVSEMSLYSYTKKPASRCPVL